MGETTDTGTDPGVDRHSYQVATVEWYRDMEIARRKIEAAQLAVLAEVQREHMGTELGYSNNAALLMHTVCITRDDANRRLEQALDLHPTTGLTGAPIEAKCPRTAAAYAQGKLDSRHIDVIRDCLDTLKDLSPEKVDKAERILVDKAQEHDARGLAKLARRIRDHVDPDGDPPKDDKPKDEPRRYFRCRQNTDGTYDVRGKVDLEVGGRLNGMLLALARPRNDGTPDRRTADERNADTFADIIIMASNCPDLPLHNGLKTEVTMTLSYERTVEKARTAGLIGDEYVSAAEARRIACDAHVIPAVLGSKSQPLDVASPSYVVPAHIRRALVLRDRGCTHPGCDRPAAACHSHHVKHWADGGETKLINLALVCNEHHHLVHDSDWDIQMIDGRVWWIRPAYLDPERAPRTNEFHRRP